MWHLWHMKQTFLLMLNSVRFPSLWSSWEGQDFCRIFWSGNWWSPNCQSSRASEFTRERHQSVQTVRTLNVNELNKNKTKAAIIFSFKLFILSLSESGSARCLSRSRSQDSSVAPCCEQVCRMGKGTLRARWRQKGSVEISWKNDRLENCFECFQCDRPSSRGRQVTQPHNGAKAPRNSSERRFYNFSTSKCLELCEACEAWSCRVFCRWIGVDLVLEKWSHWMQKLRSGQSTALMLVGWNCPQLSGALTKLFPKTCERTDLHWKNAECTAMMLEWWLLKDFLMAMMN